MKKFFLFIVLFPALFLVLFKTSFADDIDTYVEKRTASVKPNILFIIDQSLSMGYDNRQANFQKVMKDIINSEKYQGYNIALLTFRNGNGINNHINNRGKFRYQSAGVATDITHTRITPIIPFKPLTDDSRAELNSIIENLHLTWGTPTTPAYFFGANWFVDQYNHDYAGLSPHLKSSSLDKNLATNIFSDPFSGFYVKEEHKGIEYDKKQLKLAPNQGQGPISEATYCAPNSIILLTDGEPVESFQTFGSNSKDPDSERRWERKLELNTNHGSLNTTPKTAFSSSEKDCSTDGTSKFTSGVYNEVDEVRPGGLKINNTSKGGCLLDAAAFLANTDLRPNNDRFPGKQNIITHTVGFGITSDTSEAYKFLDDIAKAGKGQAYLTDNSSSNLDEAFAEILDLTATRVSYSYNAPTLPVDLSNASSTGKDSYVPLVKPRLTNFWYGNLKKYEYRYDESTMKTQLLDKYGINALDDDSQFTEEQQDFWGESTGNEIATNGVAGRLNARNDRYILTEIPDTQDLQTKKLIPLANFINNEPFQATRYLSIIYNYFTSGDHSWTAAQLKENTLRLFDNGIYNGYASTPIKNAKLTLKIPPNQLAPSINYIKIGHDTKQSKLSLNRLRGSTLNLYTKDSGNIPVYTQTFNNIERGFFTVEPKDSKGEYIHASKIEWIAPQNNTNSALTTFKVFVNENSDNSYWFTSEPLPNNGITTTTTADGSVQAVTVSKMGAPIHTKPLEINYPDHNDLSVIYLPTSEGVLHAFDSETGEELWGYMPSELVGNISLLRNNSTSNNTGAPIYGLDGQPRHFSIKKKSGETQHILVFGMRRGGSNYYALDISDPTLPKFLWTITGGTGDFEKLGQTWAAPSPMQLKLAGESTPILVISGGYDNNNDITGNPDNYTTTSNNEIGNAIYFVNALTGSREFWISNTNSGADIEVNGMNNSIVTDPETVRLDSDTFIDRLYFADIGGHIIRIDLDNDIVNNYNTTNKLDAISAVLLADINDDGSGTRINRQFFNKPTISKLKSLNGQTVFGISLGSGFRPNLASKTTLPDRFYTIFDSQPFSRRYTSTPTITTNDLYDATANTLQNNSNPAYTVSLTSLSSKSGWYIDLGSNNNIGEKSINKAAVNGGIVYFTTYLPELAAINAETHVCELDSSGSNAKFYSLNLQNATAVNPTNHGSPSDLTTEDRGTLIPNIGIAPEINITRVNVTTTDPSGTSTTSINTVITPCLLCSEQIQAPDYLRPLSWEELR